MYIAAELKKTYKKFALAKKHFGIKAQGWEKLCQKLNNEAAKEAEKAELLSKIKFL